MNAKKGMKVYIPIAALAATYILSICLLYIFEENIGGGLLYQLITSGVFCVYLIYMLIVNSEKVIQQPFSTYILIGAYLIISLLLCFPNHYVDDFGIMYLIAIPIAVFFGFRYSFVAVVAVFVLNYFTGDVSINHELQHVIYALIAGAASAGHKTKGLDWLSAFVALLLQGIVLVLGRGRVFTSSGQFVTELIVISINSLMIPFMYRLSLLKEGISDVADTVVTEESAEDSVTPSEVPVIAQTEGMPVMQAESQYPLELAYLANEDCEIAMFIKKNTPKAFSRAYAVACFAKNIAYRLGANCDLVYAAALYHDIEHLYKAENVRQMLPEYLYHMIQKQNTKTVPESIEELIVLLSNHTFKIHYYVEKNNPKITPDEIIEKIFNYQLKHGSIMTAGISMSLYHKMKQEFYAEYMQLLENLNKGR